MHYHSTFSIIQRSWWHGIISMFGGTNDPISLCNILGNILSKLYLHTRMGWSG